MMLPFLLGEYAMVERYLLELMSSSDNSVCLDMAGPWQVFEKDINRWTNDLAVTIMCGPEI